ncbi:MAG: alpha/beta hydrolase [Methylotenera sp.]|uniref:alpha/beta fold hydrolase n=1 Tax=Methylotenera sp. TaxID=2051956 RepID=UPI0024894AF6|nr:alpha/beta fold hydrolase [Methylotenera sp.]MDI1308691.1 alpha/beta hydrolase [Methylotenera sp.]
MRYLSHLAQVGQQADTLIILLPGAYQHPEDFIEQGFVSALQERKLAVDLIMAELEFSHIADQTALTEIHSELIQVAITKGYKSIWLAGISIGGYVAIAYANRYPAGLTGLLLLAPYPGNRITTGKLASAGGVQAWTPEFIPSDDVELGNWSWLKTHATATNIEVYLGYGEDDRFAESYLMMAEMMCEDRVNKIAGEHTWPVWQRLWQNFLDKRFIKTIHE